MAGGSLSKMCYPFVVTGGIHCVTGGVPVGSLGLDKRFIGVLCALIGVIGRFEAPGPLLTSGVLRSALVGCSRQFVSVTSGLLLEEGGYPLGVRRFEKDLRRVLGLRVTCGSDPLDRSIQVIVAAPQRETIGSQQEPEGSHRLPLIRYAHAASVDDPLGADEPVKLGVGVPQYYDVLIYSGEDLSEPPFGRSRGNDLLVAPR